MARNGDVNNTGTNTGSGYAVPYLAVKTQAKAAGWTVPRSSDGSTYNSTGDQITVAGSGAGGLNNAGAWYIIRDPGGRREICVQYNATTAVRIKYSANAKFTGGTPGATRVPSATDEQVILGGGTDASPTYAALINAVSYRYHVVADPTPVGNAYYLGLFVTSPGSASQTNGIFFIEPMATGSYDATDADPVVITAQSGVAYGTAANTYCWMGYGSGGSTWIQAAVTTTIVSIFNGSMGVDVGSSGDVNGRPWYSATVLGSVRSKGVGAFIAAKGPARTYPATMNTTTDAYVYLGSWVYPYINNTVPSVS